MKNQIRQGDILLVRVNVLPKNLKKRNSNIILEGEATGHAHRLYNGNVYEDGEQLYLQTIPTGYIDHEEHDKIELPAGSWKVIRQREYSEKDMTHLVID